MAVSAAAIANGVLAASLGALVMMQASAARGAPSVGGQGSYSAGNFRSNLSKLTGQNPGNADAHHVFPQKFVENFGELGIDIHDPRYGAWWDSAAHAQNSAAYNQEWAGFFRQTGRSAADAMQFASDLADRYGYSLNF
jgi:hypothetical protein